MVSDTSSFMTMMSQIPVDQIVNVSNISALIRYIEQEPDAIMNLNPHKYMVKYKER